MWLKLPLLLEWYTSPLLLCLLESESGCVCVHTCTHHIYTYITIEINNAIIPPLCVAPSCTHWAVYAHSHPWPAQRLQPCCQSSTQAAVSAMAEFLHAATNSSVLHAPGCLPLTSDGPIPREVRPIFPVGLRIFLLCHCSLVSEAAVLSALSPSPYRVGIPSKEALVSSGQWGDTPAWTHTPPSHHTEHSC